MNSSLFHHANALFRTGHFHEALALYQQIIKKYPNSPLSNAAQFNADRATLAITTKRTLSFSDSSRFFSAPTKSVARAIPAAARGSSINTATHSITSIAQALSDIEHSTNNKALTPGLTALIRAKNASRFIAGSISSVMPHVDHVIVVDNNSSDNTFSILQRLASAHPTLHIYQYNIDIPTVGKDHAEAVRAGSHNTLGTYYNWCLSKVTTYNVLKWDADFVAIQRNLKDLITYYSLRTTDSHIAVWCTGITSFAGRVIRPKSWYDEFRIFSHLHGACWENYEGCESLTNAVGKSQHCFIYKDKVDVRTLDAAQIESAKHLSKPVFFEIKDSINLKSPSMVLDARDENDNKLILDNLHLPPNYEALHKVNSFKVLITVPSLQLGGGNYWAQLLFTSLEYLGIHVHVGLPTRASRDSRCFYNLPAACIVYLDELPHEAIGSYTHIISSYPCQQLKHASSCSKIFIFTHSDVSYINSYALSTPYTIVGLNNATLLKFASHQRTCCLLNNYLSPHKVDLHRTFDPENVKLLYCNRITLDKNVPMLLHAIAILTRRAEFNGTATILCGGAETTQSEFGDLKACITRFGLTDVCDLQTSIRETSPYYESHDFCVLCSVSEGCSYNLLEAINHETPIVATHIAANIEVLGNHFPTFKLSPIEDLAKTCLSVDNYDAFLCSIGYVSLQEHSFSGEEIRHILKHYATECASDADKHSRLCIPILFDEAMYVDPAIPDQFKSYCRRQTDLFSSHAGNLAEAISLMISNYSYYSKNIRTLKRSYLDSYFSLATHRRQLYNLLFSDDFKFV